MQMNDYYRRAEYSVCKAFSDGWIYRVACCAVEAWPLSRVCEVVEHARQCLAGQLDVQTSWHQYPGGFAAFLELFEMAKIDAVNEQGSGAALELPIALADRVLQEVQNG